MTYGENQARYGYFWWPVKVFQPGLPVYEDEIRGDTIKGAQKAAEWNWESASRVEVVGGPTL